MSQETDAAYQLEALIDQFQGAMRLANDGSDEFGEVVDHAAELYSAVLRLIHHRECCDEGLSDLDDAIELDLTTRLRDYARDIH